MSNTYNNQEINIITSNEEICIECKYDKVYGLGERYNAINHKGQTVNNVVEEQFCNQGEKTYFPLPFFMLDNGYSIFVYTKNLVSFQFIDSICIKNFDPKHDKLFIFKGDYKECIQDFIELTGNTKKAPKWIFGPWISAHRWNSQAIVSDIRKKIKRLNIPVTALVLEQWSDEATFYIFNGATYPDKKVLSYEDFSYENSPWPNPKQMVQELHEEGIKLLLWQCPVVKFIPEEEPFNSRHAKEWDYVQNNRLVVWTKDKPYIIPEGHWFNGSMIPDFSNPDTLEWWFNNRQYLLDIGVDGFKTDGGEFIYSEVINHDCETMEQLKNNYALEYVKAYSDFLGDDGVAFSRAGYISQQKYSLQWAGDQKSTFEELKAIYRAGINASLCGQIHWGFDIGGFSGELPSKELYYRSNQFAVFSPIMQVHSEPVGGQFSAIDPIRAFNNERTPWNIGEGDKELLDDIRQLYNLRMNLLPYIYCEYLKALQQKSTVMKHMNIDYDGDFPEEQYLFGDLLVIPILQKHQEVREVILPKGNYYNFFTEEKVSNKIQVKNISIKDVFVYVPEGKAIVTKMEELLPERISNSLDDQRLYFRLYGDIGEYRYVDEDNDFTFIWNRSTVTTIGKVSSQITWKRIQ